MIDTKFVHEALNLPIPEKNEAYNFFRLAKRVKEGDVAFLIPSQKLSLVESADLAIERGATLLCSEEQVKNYPCLVVDDVQEAWIKLNFAYRKNYDVRVIGVTGSIGKTTTKEFIISALGDSSHVKSNVGNLNLWRNVSATIQGLHEGHEFYVQEISESPMDNATTISKMIHPEIGVMTKISESHMEKFGTIENIVASCFDITAGMSDHGMLVMNADDVYQIGYKTSMDRVTYGIRNLEANYCATNIRTVYDVEKFSVNFDVLYADKMVPIQINFLGEHNVYCALAAFATAKILGLTDKEIQSNLLTAKPKSKGIRQNLINVGSHHLYLDCFNANEESTESALKVLSLLESNVRKIRRIAVLGDISQSNLDAVRIQKDIGAKFKDLKIDVLITCGDLAKFIATTIESDVPIQIFKTSNIFEASEILQKVLEPDDIILFKASNSANLDLIADRVWGTNFYEHSQRVFKKETVVVEQYTVEIYPRANYAKIVNYSGKKKARFLPSKVNDVPVWCVGRSLFANDIDIQEIQIPDSVIRIQPRAFYKCTNLHSVELSKGLRHIGVSSFMRCGRLRSLVIPDSVIVISSKAFAHCKKLREVIISPSMLFIAEDAFMDCSNLVIIGKKGSYAKSYASAHDIKFLTVAQYRWVQLKRKLRDLIKG